MSEWRDYSQPAAPDPPSLTAEERRLQEARLIQSLGQFDADSVLEDRRWPMARPYRRLAAAPIAGVSVARKAGDIPV